MVVRATCVSPSPLTSHALSQPFELSSRQEHTTLPYIQRLFSWRISRLLVSATTILMDCPVQHRRKRRWDE